MINSNHFKISQNFILSILFGLIINFYTVETSAETALEKSILDIKKALQNFGNIPESQNNNNDNQNPNITEVFGAEPPVKQKTTNYIWKSKEDFLSSVSKGELISFSVQPNTSEDRLMTLSIAYLLSSSYGTPLKDAEKNSACIYYFESRVNYLFEIINKSKLSKLSDTPPEFKSEDLSKVEAYNANGRDIINGFTERCKQRYNNPTLYPFVNSLTLLLKEYSSLTEAYVNDMRLRKIEEFKVSQEKNRVKELDKIASDSKTKVLQAELEEKNDREMKFLAEFKRKENLKRSQCLTSQEYNKFSAAQNIEENLARIKNSNNVIKREKEISSKSGYEDGNKLYEHGQIIVYAEENIKKSLINYRKYGGTENNISRVVAGKNPCLFNWKQPNWYCIELKRASR